jgi:hypothetical protein
METLDDACALSDDLIQVKTPTDICVAQASLLRRVRKTIEKGIESKKFKKMHRAEEQKVKLTQK